MSFGIIIAGIVGIGAYLFGWCHGRAAEREVRVNHWLLGNERRLDRIEQAIRAERHGELTRWN